MTVIAYIFIFAAIVALIGIGGAICESESAAARFKRIGERASSAAAKAFDVLTMPVEAAYTFYENVKSR